jgi:hypothetical protein
LWNENKIVLPGSIPIEGKRKSKVKSNTQRIVDHRQYFPALSYKRKKIRPKSFLLRYSSVQRIFCSISQAQVVNAISPLFADNPKDSGYQGSGDCYDDEDCDTEGSGSGGGGGGRPRNGDDDSEGSGGDWDDYYRPPKAGEPEPQWPPWVTGKTPAAAQNTPPAAGPTPPPGRPEVGRPNAAPQTPPATASAATPASSALYTALLVYALPVLLTCLGSLLF